MNIKELLKIAKVEMDAAELKIDKLEDNLHKAEYIFKKKAYAYQQLVQQLYDTQKKEIAEREIK